MRISELELDQQRNIKFLVKLGKSGSEIREMLAQVYRDNAMKNTVSKWVALFSEGRESVTDEERSGRPATSRAEDNIAEIRQIVLDIVGSLSGASTEKQGKLRGFENRVLRRMFGPKRDEMTGGWRKLHH
jgi:hypothetical protein